MLRVEGVQVGRPARINGMRTAFGKRAVAGRIRVAGSALFQVASPRRPCRKIPDFWGRSDLLQRAWALAEVAALSQRWKGWLRGEPARI